MMETNYIEEEITNRVRIKLNSDKVKLWLPPYTKEDGQKGEIPADMLNRYSSDLSLSAEMVTNTLESLRLHALEKLAAQNKFKQEGIATLKIKLTGKLPPNIKIPPQFTVESSLQVDGSQLKKNVSEISAIEIRQLKMICAGHVIDDNKTLNEQGVKNQSVVMVIYLNMSEEEAQKTLDENAALQKTKEAAAILLDKKQAQDDGGEYYLQIADQTGKPLELPKEERKSLALAMTLHEKGKASLKRKEHGLALLLLLEADKEFRKCRADILSAVDNYAILCLDIVWCYLCLKNINALPDADARLSSCEECFYRSYGRNLERLTLVKGGVGTELALFMRLHLLQGIVAFHRHRKEAAQELINKAERELNRLQVDDDKLTQVISMGFSPQEARLGLRACDGSVSAAVAHITAKREERKQIRAKEKEEKKKKKIAHKLGKTKSGLIVDVNMYDMLVSMGYSQGAAAEALRQANNEINAALQILQEHPEMASLPSPVDVNITDELLIQVTSMGFNAEVAREALKRFGGSVERAVEELLSTGGLLYSVAQDEQAQPNTEGASSSVKTEEEKRLEQEAIEAIVPDIPEGEEDHLDLTLDEETEMLQEYKAYLSSI